MSINKDIQVLEGALDIFANVTITLTDDSYDDEFGTVQATGYEWTLDYVFARIDNEEIKLTALPLQVYNKIYADAEKNLPTQQEAIEIYADY